MFHLRFGCCRTRPPQGHHWVWWEQARVGERVLVEGQVQAEERAQVGEQVQAEEQVLAQEQEQVVELARVEERVPSQG